MLATDPANHTYIRENFSNMSARRETAPAREEEIALKRYTCTYVSKQALNETTKKVYAKNTDELGPQTNNNKALILKDYKTKQTKNCQKEQESQI